LKISVHPERSPKLQQRKVGHCGEKVLGSRIMGIGAGHWDERKTSIRETPPSPLRPLLPKAGDCSSFNFPLLLVYLREI